MDLAKEALFDKISSGVFPIAGSRVTFINARHHECLERIPSDDLQAVQFFKPYADELSHGGINSVCDFDDLDAQQDIVIILAPKGAIEARFWIAHGSRLLRDGGMMICTAENKSGGGRLRNIYDEYGFANVDHEGVNKSRIIWGVKENLNQTVIEKDLQNGSQQNMTEGEFISQPGVFGWNKIDRGSDILTRCVPKDLKGKGADFGCGYGYLSFEILKSCQKVKFISCRDADARALDLCEQNLSVYDGKFDTVWADLTVAQRDLRNLDFVIMNPPFHEGKKADIEIGVNFIRSAYEALRRGGRLYMVANAHLPYERALNDIFFEVEKIHEGQGFKVYNALR